MALFTEHHIGSGLPSEGEEEVGEVLTALEAAVVAVLSEELLEHDVFVRHGSLPTRGFTRSLD